ncbi:hypothetical protein HK102_000620 [Quaeritorhiza haematococci]|nr:hypothetical protein HK102_000620 [Quaeritorhiza haematococci]
MNLPTLEHLLLLNAPNFGAFRASFTEERPELSSYFAILEEWLDRNKRDRTGLTKTSFDDLEYRLMRQFFLHAVNDLTEIRSSNRGSVDTHISKLLDQAAIVVKVLTSVAKHFPVQLVSNSNHKNSPVDRHIKFRPRLLPLTSSPRLSAVVQRFHLKLSTQFFHNDDIDVFITRSIMQSIITHCQSLEALCFDFRRLESEEDCLELVSRLGGKLKHLELGGLVGVHANTLIDRVADSCPNLEWFGFPCTVQLYVPNPPQEQHEDHEGQLPQPQQGTTNNMMANEVLQETLAKVLRKCPTLRLLAPRGEINWSRFTDPVLKAKVETLVADDGQFMIHR